MLKRIYYGISIVIYLSVYIAVCIKVFTKGDAVDISYVQNEYSFGSVTLLGAFVLMTFILLIFLNNLIDRFTNRTIK